ncbi:hypothetical protein QR665_13000 [Acinetobacter gerneri]|uniref:hypothetical protein n=1 Tax=Acinetobacter gerneri TaxID=202952 RepID=UPI0028A79639|nr:hypothetical protein [Acinetobacter gerneri]MDV2440383.1 hypothetical protein [Acinetobacter gerneri]
MTENNQLDYPKPYLNGTEEAMNGFPKKVEQCDVPEPFCIFQFKKKVVQPYNFMMPLWAWDYVLKKNKLEYLMAIRYGLEFDLTMINSNELHRPAFHTLMYVNFQYYLKKHAMKEMSIVVAEFEKTAFSTRFKSTFAVKDLLSLKGTIDNLNVVGLTIDATNLAKNGFQGTAINRKMFKRIFNQDYDPRALASLAQDRKYPDSGEVRSEW